MKIRTILTLMIMSSAMLFHYSSYGACNLKDGTKVYLVNLPTSLPGEPGDTIQFNHTVQFKPEVTMVDGGSVPPFVWNQLKVTVKKPSAIITELDNNGNFECLFDEVGEWRLESSCPSNPNLKTTARTIYVCDPNGLTKSKLPTAPTFSTSDSTRKIIDYDKGQEGSPTGYWWQYEEIQVVCQTSKWEPIGGPFGPSLPGGGIDIIPADPGGLDVEQTILNILSAVYPGVANVVSMVAYKAPEPAKMGTFELPGVPGVVIKDAYYYIPVVYGQGRKRVCTNYLDDPAYGTQVVVDVEWYQIAMDSWSTGNPQVQAIYDCD